MRSARPLDTHSISWAQLSLLAGTLILPGIAFFHATAGFGPAIRFCFVVIPSVVAYFVCLADKKRAQQNVWRISESTLHFFEIMGGWPGAFLAQRRYRHKTSKRNYQVTFWLIITAWQFFSADYLFDWKPSAWLFSHLG